MHELQPITCYTKIKITEDGMVQKTGASLLIDCLIEHDVEYIFGIPGAKVDSIFDTLADKGPQLILCRHEQNAAFMAAMYGRLTGKPGVVLVTSGPGVSNLATGLLTATTEGDPVIAIGGNVSRFMRLKQSHQSADNVGLMRPVTKFSTEVMVTRSIPEVVENAFRAALQPRRGAAFMSFPQDVLTEKTDSRASAINSIMEPGSAASELIEQVAHVIDEADCPVLFLGMDTSQSKIAKAVRDLLYKSPLGTVSTFQAAGVVSRDLLQNFVGRVGLFKNQPADELLDKADVIITVGFNPVEYDPEVWNPNNDKLIIHIDASLADIHLTYRPKFELVGCISRTLKKLSHALLAHDQVRHAELVQKLGNKLQTTINEGANKQGALVHPLRFIHDLHKVADDNTTLISDIGSHYMWMARYCLSFRPHHLLFSNGQQTLGVALPWAMIASKVRPNEKVISVSGDGGFLFSAMELETAVREKCNFVHCIWKDGSYNMVAEQEVMKYNRKFGVEFGPVDYVKFAESFGAKGYKVESSDQLLPILNQALQDPGPVLIEVPIDYSDNQSLFLDTHAGHHEVN
jgi:acetolactate synthase-1/2/3 large subunit